jgi:hypothetical protein
MEVFGRRFVHNSFWKDFKRFVYVLLEYTTHVATVYGIESDIVRRLVAVIKVVQCNATNGDSEE